MEVQNLDPNPEKKPCILIADSHISVRTLVCDFLRQKGQFSAVHEATSGLDIIRLTRNYEPKLIVLELELPEMSGPEVIRTIKAEQHEVRFVVYSGSSNLSLIQAGIDSRPQGFAHKTELLDVFAHTVTMVDQGYSFFSPYASQLMHEKKSRSRHSAALSPRERSVVQLIAEGKSTKEAAALLSLSAKTVEHYRKNLMKKLNLNCVALLTIYAVRNGLVKI